jgi:hypothetical protein
MPAQASNFSVHDIRSEAKTYRRDKTHNTKWANGTVPRSGIKCVHLPPWTTGCTICPSKPAKAPTKFNYGVKPKKAHYRDVIDDVDEVSEQTTDTSADEGVKDASFPTEDFMYSYDATSGPVEGRDILSTAITQAVRRFENTETEKLVNKEYDVIDETKDGYAADEDDDFEVIDYSHLK